MSFAQEMYPLPKLFKRGLNLIFMVPHLDAVKSVHFWDLPETTRFVLDRNFCAELFDKAAGGSLRSLASKLGVSYPRACHLRRPLYSIPKGVLMCLIILSAIEKADVENKIIEIKTRSGGGSKVKFPINGNRAIASLVGHVFGDGCIYSKKRQFEYGNTKPELLESVMKLVGDVLCAEPIRIAETRLVYSAIVGDILLLFGAPKAPKLNSDSPVPEWIMAGPNEFKAAFLGALFDDDGSVMYSEKYAAKGINLYQTRHEKNLDCLMRLMSQVKTMLSDFGILAGKPSVSRSYSKPDGAHIVAYLNVTDIESMRKFNESIGFAHIEKKVKLEKILSRKIIYSKTREAVLSKEILGFLAVRGASTAKVSEALSLDKSKALKKLLRLESRGLVRRAGRAAPNRSFIWQTREVTC
ncbi:MAG: LAGLIDADG family homing endonuclease [Candidatus Diapherotrites archaeon]